MTAIQKRRTISQKSMPMQTPSSSLNVDEKLYFHKIITYVEAELVAEMEERL